ncbi:MAG: C45 family peptidase [Lentisphaerae bacterium]|nr:C45 family peptidase [Lentisphaerota bacterium]
MKQLLTSEHTMVELAGSPRTCGRQYGDAMAERMEAFLHAEVTPDAQRLRYAARCWDVLRRWDPAVVQFIHGLAEGSGLSLVQVTLLLLHEEVEHLKHCTAIGATGAATRDGAPIIGQNWDWLSHLYPWSHLTRLKINGQPRALFYSYPGLWAGAGLNDYGLSFCWTSGGVWPKVKPKVGIPSYALIAGLLARRSCAEALTLLRRTRNAGAFIFMLADVKGALVVVEGVPHKIEIMPVHDIATRATYFESPRMCRLSRQDLTSKPVNPQFRGERIAAMARRDAGHIDAARVESYLRDERETSVRSVCCQPKDDFRWMTLDSFYMLPRLREFWIARGSPRRHAFRRYEV